MRKLTCFNHCVILISAMIEQRVRVCNSILGGHENFPEGLLLEFSLSERAISHSYESEKSIEFWSYLSPCFIPRTCNSTLLTVGTQ